MKIGIWLSTLGGSPLQSGLERGLRDLGHAVHQWRSTDKYDLVLMFNQTAHNAAYVYPEVPRPDQHIAFIDTAEYGWMRRTPETFPLYANAFTDYAMAHDTKNLMQQMAVKRALEGRSFPYFLREFAKCVAYPSGYHPIDYPLYHQSDCPTPPNREQYLKRPHDIFLSWGASHPWRLNLTQELRGAHPVGDILVIEENGTPRMPQQLYFNRMLFAKCSASFDGYGSGSFRMTEVLTRTLLLQGPLSIVTREPLIDGVHCIQYDVVGDKNEFISTNITDCLKRAIQDPEKSFEIYRNGWTHCREKLSERATAQYVIDTAMAHDWSKPTDLEIKNT